MKRAKIISISIEPDKLSRLDKLAELYHRSRSGLITMMTDENWERYIITEAGRKALEQAQQEHSNEAAAD